MNIALIFAGGVGSRMHGKEKPKQFLEIHGKAIIIHTIEQFEYHSQIDAIAMVCVAEWLDYLKSLIDKSNFKKVKWIVPGGATALDSQLNGLNAIVETLRAQGESSLRDSVVLIHDGVRPLIDAYTISNCISGVRQHGSAITIAPANETIIKTDDTGKIVSTIKRSDCQLARAPQSFYIQDILEAHYQAINDGKHDYIDSASLMIASGKDLYVVEGPSENIKVTTPLDFYIYRAILDAKENSQLNEL